MPYRAMLVAGMASAVLGCGGTRVMIPPRIDLTQHEVLGVLEFPASNEGELGSLVTRRFIEFARQDQGLVRIVDLGPQAEALEAIGRQRLDADALRALGEKHQVQSIFAGRLEISNVRPVVRIDPGLLRSSVAADVDASLVVQLVETATGASLWSNSASASRRVGHVRVLGGGDFAFDATDPDRAYADLVEALAYQVSRDFRASWERR